MTLNIQIPDELVERLVSTNTEGTRAVLEAVAADGYRRGALTRGEVTRLLGYGTPIQTDEFLRNAGVFRAYDDEDLRLDAEALRAFGA